MSKQQREPYRLPPLENANAAGRLHRVLKPLVGQAGQRQLDQVASFFGVPPRPGKFEQALSDLWKQYELLAEDVAELQQSRPRDYATYKSKMQFIQESLHSIFLVGKTAVNVNVNDAAVASLEFMASGLPIEGDVPESDLDQLREALEALRSQVEQATDISPTLRKWLLELTRAMKDGLERFAIRGARGLSNELSVVIGELARRHENRQELKTHKGLFDQLKNVVELFDKVTAVAERCAPALEHFGPMVLAITAT